ncbi:hypothetical protein VB711_11695 [Cronbergia sp. UHCC 0137]|nr:hypothetical protein [Cronbergia sp. UHCC 0137]MEA5618493.1 hypothetical protein [Cronbergia sp. UHCC 0137]
MVLILSMCVVTIPKTIALLAAGIAPPPNPIPNIEIVCSNERSLSSLL